MNRPVRLQVNVDHVATLRQARRSPYPDPIELATLALEAGASGITVHLRGDRRHIQDEDVRRLRRELDTRLNLEMAATEEMVSFALAVGPDQVSLVPERPEEITTEGGLDLVQREAEIVATAHRLADAGIEVSLFLDPDSRQIARLEAFKKTLHGFEINTDAYTRAAGVEREEELEKIRTAAGLGAALGYEVYAGHGLTATNVGPIAAVPEIVELNIGHWLICRAVAVGMGRAVQEMLAAMRGPV